VANLGGVCVDPCCNNSACPAGYQCTALPVSWAGGSTLNGACAAAPCEYMRVCVSLPTPASLQIAP
jgi:hypothetical protein